MPSSKINRVLPLLLVLLVALAAVLCANPFGNFAFDDDFAYSNIALQWANTGAMHYNGWSAHGLLVQVPLGGLLIRAAGFSFDLLRWLTIGFYLLWAGLLYYFFLEYRIPRVFSAFAVLAVVLCPLTLPLAGSFMCDVYAFCAMFGSLLAGLIYLRHKESLLRSAGWLSLSLAIGIAGGADRYNAWAAPLAVILTALVYHWRRRRFQAVAIAQGLVAVACMWAIVHWLKARPNFQYHSVHFGVFFTGTAIRDGIRCILTCFLFGVPLLVAVGGSLAQAARKWKMVAAALGLTAVAVCLVVWINLHGHMFGPAPWLGNMVTPYGILDQGEDLLGQKPVILPDHFRIFLSALALFPPILFAIATMKHSAYERLRSLAADETARARLILLVPVVAMVLALAVQKLPVFDRYLVPILPCLFVAVAAVRPLPPRPAAAGWLALFLFSAFAIGLTHDYSAARRASLHLLQQLEARGIDRYDVSAGLELNGADHLKKANYLRMCDANPPAGGDCALGLMNDWRVWEFQSATFTIGDDYVLAYSDIPGYERFDALSAPYTTWIPPAHRQILCLRKLANLSDDASLPRNPQ